MRKWEYKIIDSRDACPRNFWTSGRDPATVERFLTALGAEGWEIVNIDILELEGGREFVGLAKRESP